MQRRKRGRAEPVEASLFTRRRFQFAGAVLLSALVPWLARGPLLPGTLIEHASVNTLTGNAIAVVIAFWMRLSIETYPGIRRSAVILPATLTGHGVIVAWFLLTRLPYDRLALTGGFVLHLVWLYLLYIYAERNLRRTDRCRAVWSRCAARADRQRQLAHDEASAAGRLAQGPGDRRRLLGRPAGRMGSVPRRRRARRPHRLSGQAIVGKSLTGRVELEHLSENSFGSLVPARGYFYLKSVVDFLFAVAVLPLALPLMALIAVAIRLDGPGTILFRQKRIGHAGKRSQSINSAPCDRARPAMNARRR